MALETLKTQLAQSGANDPVLIKVAAFPQHTVTAGDLAVALGVTQQNFGSLWANEDGIRVRAVPSTGTVLDVVNRCDEVVQLSSTIQTVNGYTWAYVRVKETGIVGYTATKVIQTGQLYYVVKNPCSETPIPKPAGFGFHMFNGTATDQIVQLAKDLKAEGKPLRAMVIVNESRAVDPLVDTVDYVLYRDVPTGGNPDNPTDAQYASGNGAAWVAGLMPRYAGINKRAYLQLMNEGTWKPGAGTFWLNAMKYADSIGRKLAIFAYSIGNPDDEGGMSATAKWATLVPALTYAKANGHPVVMHAYSAPGTPAGQMTPEPNRVNYEGRFIRLYNSVPESAWADLIFGEVASEYYTGAYQGDVAAEQYADTHISFVRPYKYVKADCWWTANGSGEWANSNINPAIPRLAALARRRFL